jgi:CheY-like chemotaxis protein
VTDPADKLAGRTGALDSFAVVIVDNDRETLHMLVEQLRHEGAVVTCFRNAMLALAYAERHRVDSVLFNLDMPAADGWWFARQMRALPERSQIPVYAVGGRVSSPPTFLAALLGISQSR